MAGSIENKFKGISIRNHAGNSDIKIRRGLHFPNLLNLNIIVPKAIVKCGSCKNEYKKILSYLLGSPFVIENEELKCGCGNIDYITYAKSPFNY